MSLQTLNFVTKEPTLTVGKSEKEIGTDVTKWLSTHDTN